MQENKFRNHPQQVESIELELHRCGACGNGTGSSTFPGLQTTIETRRANRNTTVCLRIFSIQIGPLPFFQKKRGVEPKKHSMIEGTPRLDLLHRTCMMHRKDVAMAFFLQLVDRCDSTPIWKIEDRRNQSGRPQTQSRYFAPPALLLLGCPFSDPPLKVTNFEWVKWKIPH